MISQLNAFKSYLPLYGLAGFDLFRGLDWLIFFGGGWCPIRSTGVFQVIPDLRWKHRWSLDRSWTNWPIGGHPSRFCWRHFQRKTVGCDGKCWGGMGVMGKGLLLWFLAWFLFPELDGSYGQRDVVICLYKLMSPKHVGKKSANTVVFWNRTMKHLQAMVLTAISLNYWLILFASGSLRNHGAWEFLKVRS